MDGVTSTAAEINLIDGGTARGTTALASGDGILINDGGTMRMTNVDTVQTFMQDGAGISEIDQWRVTANFSGATNPISSNWERVDSKGSGYLGTGMAVSSGIWTFPSTGFYKVEFYTSMYLANDTSTYAYPQIKMTTDNSAYTTVAIQAESFGVAGVDQYHSAHVSCIFDVTNTTNVKMQLGTADQTDVNYVGSTDESRTGLNVIRLADT